MKQVWLLLLLATALGTRAQNRPNIIFIMSDDHDLHAISAYDSSLLQTPHIDRLAREGMLFTRAFVGNSICAPSRATLITGQHSHKNGVIDNRTSFDTTRTTMPHLMQLAGYETAVVGKWHLHSYPTGFDYWKVLPGMGTYFNTRVIDMPGDTSRTTGYATDVITDEAIEWLNERKSNQPFMLLLHQKAPHRYFMPPLDQLEKFCHYTFPEPRTLYEDTAGHGSAWRIETMSILRDMELCSDLKVDPVYLENNPALRPSTAQVNYYHAIMRQIPAAQRARYQEIYAERGKFLQAHALTGDSLLKYKYQWYMQDYLACCASIDNNTGKLLDYLDQHGLADNTIVIYTSDQGFYMGENGWFDKRFMYDISMRIPLLVRWPGHIAPGSRSEALVQNIDFAPTFLDIAGAAIPDTMQGLSLLPLLTRQKQQLSRRYLYYHYYEFVKDHTVIPHLGIRGDRYKLIWFYTVNEWQLFDLQQDPDELHNLIREPGRQGLIRRLKKELTRLQKEYGDTDPAISVTP